ncbi:trafficking protein particle complex 3 [Penaeus vannamei]|uniref:Trafficking protein particle complex 3 n=1 Tax=Penaeus vannamei TaxID=6689 RepID=A0A3R7PCB6_PENVA|nr:trafficking protein particle complex 3 [Penaeus vannamei]
MSRQSMRSNDPKKVSGELFTLTYGSLVAQLLKDYENVDDVNRQLERMGYNIGMRLIEDFLARANPGRCYDLRDTADKIQQAFKLYLGVSPSIGSWSPGGDEFSVVLETNPLAEFVELPDHCLSLRYSNILAGVIPPISHLRILAHLPRERWKSLLTGLRKDIECSSIVYSHLEVEKGMFNE